VPYLSLPSERLFYAQFQGGLNRQARTLVLVHGAGGNHTHWPAELRRLPGVNVYALDLPGHGRSSGKGRLNLEEYTDIVAAFVGALGLSPICLVGHSMGGAIVQLLAVRQPAWLECLVVVGCGPQLPVDAAVLTGLHPGAGPAAHAVALDRICQLAYGPGASSPLVRLGRRVLAGTAPEVLYADYAACSAFDISGRLDRLRVPVLIIVGSADQLTPPQAAARLRERVPAARLVQIEGAGHMVVLEKPMETAQAIVRFLDAL
jgi:pimeloyl-ACP methyl ester carboxylesterase